MKKILLLLVAIFILVSGCMGTHLRSTMTAPTTYTIKTDCK